MKSFYRHDLFNYFSISAKVAGPAKVQYTHFTINNKVMEKMEQFDLSKDRVDEFSNYALLLQEPVIFGMELVAFIF